MRCPACAAQIPADAATCSECGEPFPPKAPIRPAPVIHAEAVIEAEAIEVAQAPLANQAEAIVQGLPPEKPLHEPMTGKKHSLIPYRNPKALASYYLGFFALVPVLGLVMAPPAILFGILGLRTARADPGAQGSIHAAIGLFLGSFALLCYQPGVLLMIHFLYS